MKIRLTDTKCLECGRACGGCSWSDRLEPVEGWTAAPGNNEGSWQVIECPQFLSEASGRHRPPAWEMDTEGCIALLEKTMEAAREDFIRGSEAIRSEVTLFIQRWFPNSEEVLSTLRKEAKEYDRKQVEKQIEKRQKLQELMLQGGQ